MGPLGSVHLTSCSIPDLSLRNQCKACGFGHKCAGGDAPRVLCGETEYQNAIYETECLSCISDYGELYIGTEDHIACELKPGYYYDDNMDAQP